ncbi:MAG: AI-2E family transporter, partial [Anaerolineae bacterium]
MDQPIDVRSRMFFYGIFAALILLTFLLLKPFFSVLALSVITVILLKPVYTLLLKTERIAGHERLAASLALAAFILALIVPIFFIAYISLNQLSELLQSVGTASFAGPLTSLNEIIHGIAPQAPDLVDGGQLVSDLQALSQTAAVLLGDVAISIVSALPGLILQGMIFLVVVVTLLPIFDNLIARAQAISPLGSELSELYYRKTTAMVTSLVKGVFLIAIIQGAAMGVFFWLAGIPYTFLLSLLSMVLAMLPVVGISYLALIVALLLALSGRFVDAAIVLFGFYGVVNWIDLLLRPRLISKEAYLNFALVLLGIIGGLMWAGLLGLIYGPVILLLLVTTIDIYAETYAKDDGVILRSLVAKRGDKDT